MAAPPLAARFHQSLAKQGWQRDYAVVSFFPPTEPAFVSGQPYIYGLYWTEVDGWYVGKNETGRADYMGSPSQAALNSIADAHCSVGLSSVPAPAKRLLWSPAGATREECRNQEWYWIAKVRANHHGPVFNLFPIEDWSNHFDWVHDHVTHVDRASNSRWPVVYIKRQASPDSEGRCSGGKANWYRRECGEPWGEHPQEKFCKVVYLDGREVQLPGGNPYDAFRKHKLAMTRGEDPWVRPRNRSER